MARPYSEDLRARLVEAVEAGATRQATARRFGVSVSCVVKLVQRWRRSGTLAPGQLGGWKKPALAAHEDRVRALVTKRPDSTLDELRAALARENVRVSRWAVWRFLLALGLTRKKRRSMPPSGTAPTSRRRAKPGARANRR
jgi:putative transposase